MTPACFGQMTQMLQSLANGRLILVLEVTNSLAVKIIPELRDLSYKEPLKECGLTTLKTRRLRINKISF